VQVSFWGGRWVVVPFCAAALHSLFWPAAGPQPRCRPPFGRSRHFCVACVAALRSAILRGFSAVFCNARGLPVRCRCVAQRCKTPGLAWSCNAATLATLNCVLVLTRTGQVVAAGVRWSITSRGRRTDLGSTGVRPISSTVGRSGCDREPERPYVVLLRRQQPTRATEPRPRRVRVEGSDTVTTPPTRTCRTSTVNGAGLA
jgi:hypothetical protein